MGACSTVSVRSANFVDFQRRALTFKVGDVVFPVNGDTMSSGRVVALFPAIGMADVEFPSGNKRYPVEDLQISTAGDVNPPETKTVPGGAGTVPVSFGVQKAGKTAPSAQSVVEAFVKKAIYWNGPDRQYRATKGEKDSKSYLCPKCLDVVMKPAIYKRIGGKSERLLGCPSCLFLVRLSDCLGHHTHGDD